MPKTRAKHRPKIRRVTVRLKQGRQTIGSWDVTLDPTDAVQVRTLLARLLDERGIEDPTTAHRVELYEADGAWIGEVAAT